MSTVDLEVPDDLDPPTTQRVDKEGWYHFIIEDVDLQPSNKDGEPLDGFKIELQVLEGTVRMKNVCTEIGKNMNVVFFEPSGEYAAKSVLARYRLATATGLVDDAFVRAEKAAGRKPDLAVNWADLKSKQFVARVYIDKNKFAKLSEDIWPLNHAKVAHVPLDKEAASYVTAARANGNGTAQPQTQQPAAQNPAPAKGKKVALNDL